MPELAEQGVKVLLDNVFETGVPFHGNEIELLINRAQKKERGFYNFVYQPIRELDQEVTGIMVVATEVTHKVLARKRKEEQAAMIQTLLMTAPGFVCTLRGPRHIYQLVNERYQQLVGKRKIQGKPILVALPELEGQGFDTVLDNVYNTGIPYVGIDVPLALARDEGLIPELRYFNFSYQPMYDEQKRIYSILVFGYEVTDQVLAKNKLLAIEQEHAKYLEEKVFQRTAELSEANDLLHQKNEVLKNMNTELESFTFISSHDLQEPLRKIRTFSNRIIENESAALSDIGKDDLSRMHNAATRMQILIDDLLAYSHTSMAEIKFQVSDLDMILAEVKEQFSDDLLDKNAVIESGPLGNAYINHSQFRQVMTNLISNALKYSDPARPPHISVHTRIADGSYFQNENPGLPAGRLLLKKNYCHISFSDNGLGFDTQYKDKIFEIFQRLHVKEDFTGTGIGLAIVKKIVENHNGIITATGELGKGARFDIYIPAA